MQGNRHVLQYLGSGNENNYNYLLMEVAGESVYQLLKRAPGNKFPLPVAAEFGYNFVQALEEVHNAGYLHKDVKAANFVLKYDENLLRICIIDFGVAEKIENNDELENKSKIGFVGTLTYASTNVHERKPYGRHDDLLSMFYTFLEISSGKLPWAEDDNEEAVALKKWKTTPEMLIGRKPEAAYQIYIAIKIEVKRRKFSTVQKEAEILKHMQGNRHVLQYLGSGNENNYNYLVMEVAGESVHQLLKRAQGNKFPLPVAAAFGYNFVEALEEVHNAGYLHKDVKAENFVLKYAENLLRICIIDFGVAEKIENNDELENKSKIGFVGTLTYASTNVHERKPYGRHDDLLSMFYTFLEISSGKLPWAEDDNEEAVALKKWKTTPEMLIGRKPEAAYQIYSKLQSLTYKDRIDYAWFKDKFRSMITNEAEAEGETRASELKQQNNINGNTEFSPMSTLTYASTNVHERKPYGRHDDLLSMFYTFLEISSGKLPWAEDDNEEAVALKKWKTTPEMLIGRKPEAAYQIYSKLQSLTYKDRIDYAWFKDKFRSMITNEAEAEGETRASELKQQNNINGNTEFSPMSVD
ncbi:Tau-tubulin kinase 1, partial [Trichinella sp. T9]